MEIKDTDIEGQLTTCFKAACNILNIKSISKNTYNAVLENLKFYLAVEYLKKNDWNKNIPLTKLALMMYKEGKYYGIYHDEQNKFQDREVTFSYLREYFSKYEESDRNEINRIYNTLLECHRMIDFEKKKKSFIYKHREQFAKNTAKLKLERKSRETLKQFEIAELISIFYLHKFRLEELITTKDTQYYSDLEELKMIRDTHRRFNNQELKLINYDRFEDMVAYFKIINEWETFDNNTTSNNEIRNMASDLMRLVKLKIIDENIAYSPMFKYYLYYTIEQKYSLETIKAFSNQLRKFNKKTERDKEGRKEKRDTFKKDILTVLTLPLIKERCEYINDYMLYYDINDLESWRYEVKVLSNLIPITFTLIKNWIDGQAKDRQNQLYEKLVNSINASEFIKSYNSFNNNIKYEEDFLPVNFQDVCKIIMESSKTIKDRIMKSLDESLLSEDFCIKLAESYNRSVNDLPDAESEDIFLHRYEETFNALYERILQIIHRDRLL